MQLNRQLLQQQSATQAVAALSPTSGGAQSSTSVAEAFFFEPKDREAELSGIRDWWWQVEQYFNYGADLMYVRSHINKELPLVEQDPERTQRSGFLYGLLASLLKQRPLLLLSARNGGADEVRFGGAFLPACRVDFRKSGNVQNVRVLSDVQNRRKGCFFSWQAQYLLLLKSVESFHVMTAVSIKLGAINMKRSFHHSADDELFNFISCCSQRQF